MLAIIRALAILIVIYFIIIMLKDKSLSLAFMVVGLGVFIIYNIAFVIYHPFIGLIAMLSLILIVGLFVLDSKREIDKYKLRRIIYPLIGIYSFSFTFQLIETAFGRLF